jgi:two-component system probable response regulator PhcQ
MSQNMNHILLIDDDPSVLAALQRALRRNEALPDLQVETYTDPYAALNRVCECEFDLVICDFMMPQMSGGDLLSALRDVAPDTVRIMLSGSTDFGTAMNAINHAQVFRFLSKPWQPEQLEQYVRLALEQRQLLLAETARRPPPDAHLTPQEREAERLELEEPGLMHVRRAADGSIIL